MALKKGVDVRPRPGVEAEVELRRRGRARDDVDVREARLGFALIELRDTEGREHGFVEPHAPREVAGVDVEVIDDAPRPIPCFGAHQSGSKPSR